MSRDVPFCDDAICDECGRPGAYDFMGDSVCPTCITAFQESVDEEEELKKLIDTWSIP